MNTKCNKIYGNHKEMQNRRQIQKLMNTECKKMYGNDKEMQNRRQIQIQANEYGM